LGVILESFTENYWLHTPSTFTDSLQ